MEISIVAGAIALIVFLVWLSKKLNFYSMETYHYAPIGLGTIVLGMIPFILIIAGFILQDKSPENLQMALLFASLSIMGLFGWIANQSSWKVALGAIVILLIVGLPSLLVLFLSGSDEDYYYYD